VQEDQYGLLGLWTQTDLLGKGVALTLLLMSVLSWCVIVIKACRLMQLRRMAARAVREFWHAHSFREGLELLSQQGGDNPFRTLAEEGAEAVQHHADNQQDLHGALNISDWVTSNLRRVIDEAAQGLQSGLSVLASTGSTAPFVGLLGTVWGIYHALIGISKTGAASIDQVAGPVGEALIMTAFGLIVAIPAVLAYNALVRGNKTILAQLQRFAHDLHAYFVTGAGRGPAGRAQPAAGGRRILMAFGNDPASDEDVMSEINMTPLVDVMLVLLIIFMITMPVITHAVKVQLPQAASQSSPTPPDPVELSIDAAGQYFWNDEPLSFAQLEARLAAAAQQAPQPELRVNADRQVRYDAVAQALAAAQRAGLHKLGFVTLP